MKKVLLSLMAVLASVGMYAQYTVGQYIYTNTARFKVTQDVEIPQPALGSAQWTGIDGLFDNYEAEDENDFNGIMANKDNATEEDKIYVSFPLEYAANYIFTFKFAGVAAGTSSIDPTVANYVDAWVSKQDDQGTKPTAEDVFKQQVASTFTISAYEWTEASWSFAVTDTALQDAENIYLNLVFAKLPIETKIASNMQLVKVNEVYDIRPMQKRIDFVKQLMVDPNFNTEEAAEMKGELEGAIEAIEAEIETEAYEDPATGAETLDALNGFVENFLGVTSTNMNAQLGGIDKPFSSLATWNNGTTYDNKLANLKMSGGRWAHRASNESCPDCIDFINAAIQRSQPFNDHTIKVVNSNFTSGKYFISAEVRVASCPSNAWTFVFNKSIDNATMYIGSNVYEIGEIPAGMETKKVYAVGEIKDGEAFEAGFFVPGIAKADNTTGIAFFIKNIEVRAFNDVVDKINRSQDWNTFKEQWNAATSNINAITSKLNDPNYPYVKDSLQNALTNWKPYYDQVLADGWVDADGNDTGVASNAQLLEWAQYQGVELYNEETEDRLEYQLVRNLQWANNYSAARNKIITDFNALIATAEAEFNDDMNQDGDKDTFDEDIKEAKGVIADVLATATDDTYETDSLTLATATENLNKAIEDFKKSAEMKPFIDIDFSNEFTAVEEIDPETQEEIVTAYTVNGVAGQMVFGPSAVHVNNEDALSGTPYQLGMAGNEALNEVLRVGNTEATVAIEGLTDQDVLRVQFDLWVGSLINNYVRIQLQNAAGERVAGFSIDRYDSRIEYNDFNNAENTGMDINKYVSSIGSSSQSDAAICVDANKSSFDLIIDYKANTVQGTVVNGKNGTGAGVVVPLTKALDDNKIAKFVLSSSYGNTGRRCWFDNLKIFKYASSATEEDPVSINSVTDNTSNVAAGIYTISGAKVNALQKGINIVKMANGQVQKVYVK